MYGRRSRCLYAVWSNPASGVSPERFREYYEDVHRPDTLAIGHFDRSYRYEYDGEDVVDGRSCHVLRFEPVDPERTLYRGRIWIDKTTWARVRESNQRYHARYPGDPDRLRTILRRLEGEDVRLPNGDRLTARRFRQIGMWLGDSAGFERLHHLLELPFASAAFLWDA